MQLSTKNKEYIIPEYSLTGDLLPFLTCNLQYRYQNKGNLPHSMTNQFWFGEFIHGALEEAFLKWKNHNDNEIKFPWDWEKEIYPIEELITERLKIEGSNPPNNYDPKDGPKNNIYSARLEQSINKWGPHIFPLIDNTKILLKGLRKLDIENARSEYYSINGVVDVLSSKKVNDESKVNEEKNKILYYLSNNEEFKKSIKNEEEYEIIIDYKGMRRPDDPSEKDFSKIQSKMINGNLHNSEEYFKFKTWIQHTWKILTYAWLRNNQKNTKKIVTGIIFYLNELVPSNNDLKNTKKDLKTEQFKMDKSIRIININEDLTNNFLNEFDKIVKDIESSMIKEMSGLSIKKVWKANAEKSTCISCDFRTFCNKEKCDDSDELQEFTIP